MNIKNLEVGMVVKNYKELCKLLEVKYSAGNTKISQMAEFDRFVKYDKEGYKFIIEEIYKTPKEKYDGRSEGNNSRYVDDIRKLILDLLAQDGNKGTVELPVGKLLESLNMINHNYRSCRNNIPKLSEFLDVDVTDIYDFYDSTQSKIKSNLKRALEKLRSERLIYVTPFITVSFHNESTEDKNHRHIHRPATKKEVEMILKAEKLTMKEMDLPNIGIVCASNRYREWKVNVNKKLYNWGKISYYYECYRIANYKDGILELLDEIERKETKTNINQNVRQSTINTAQKRHDKEVEQGWFGVARNKRCYPKYVDDAKVIANNIIDENAQRITLK